MQKLLSLTVLLLCLFSAQAFAAQVVNVDFEGLVTVSEGAARSQIQSIEGTKFSRRSVKKDIKALYRSGLFSNVIVDKQRISGGLRLIFRVVEKKLIGKLTITGNKKLKTEDLQEVIPFRESDFLDPAQIADAKAGIVRLYEEKGYHLIEVTSHIEPFDQEQGQVELILRVDENRRVKIRRIRFLGNRAFSDKKLKKEMRTKEKGSFSFLSGSGKFDADKLANDIQMLRFFYLDHGYLRVKVDKPRITLTRNKEAIYISVPVHEGDRYKMSGTDVVGDILTTKDELLSLLSLKVGETYKKSLEIADIKALQAFYGDQAYAFVNILPYVEANDDTKEAKVTYVVQKGPKIKIDKIIIKGNDVTRDKVIRRELKLVENAYFSQSALELSRARLYQLGFFEEVNFSTPRGSRENTVNIVIEVTEKNTGTFSIGAGFSTLENFIFTASVQKENFFGHGWGGGVSLNLSKLRQDIVVSLSDPRFLDSHWSLGLSFQRYLSQLNTDFDRDLLGGTVSLGRELFDFFHIRFGYRIEDLEVKNFSAQVPQFFQDNNSSGFVSGFFAGFNYDRRDNRIVTKKGYYVSANVEYSFDEIGADTNYIEFSSDNRIFFKLPLNLVFKGRGSFHYINSLDGNSIPLYKRYFLGGISTLRGYELNSVGPQIRVPATATGEDTRFVYGGTKQILFNAEIEIPVYEPAGFFAVAFFDAGDVFGEDEDLGIRSLKMDYGFGIRWHSPMGPLRFEWGFPINKREADDPGMVFNFSIGQSF